MLRLHIWVVKANSPVGSYLHTEVKFDDEIIWTKRDLVFYDGPTELKIVHKAIMDATTAYLKILDDRQIDFHRLVIVTPSKTANLQLQGVFQIKPGKAYSTAAEHNKYMLGVFRSDGDKVYICEPENEPLAQDLDELELEAAEKAHDKSVMSSLDYAMQFD